MTVAELIEKLETALDIIDMLCDHTEVPEPIEQQIESIRAALEEVKGQHEFL